MHSVLGFSWRRRRWCKKRRAGSFSFVGRYVFVDHFWKFLRGPAEKHVLLFHFYRAYKQQSHIGRRCSTIDLDSDSVDLDKLLPPPGGESRADACADVAAGVRPPSVEYRILVYSLPA